MDLLLAFALASTTSVSQCPVSSENGLLEYSAFYHTSFVETGKTEDGDVTAIVRSMTQDQIDEAWSCLNSAADKGYCGALFLLEGCYEGGWDQAPFNCSKNPELAARFEQRRSAACTSE